MRKNDAFVAKMVNTRLTKVFMTIFAPDERLPTSATLSKTKHDFGEILVVEAQFNKNLI